MLAAVGTWWAASGAGRGPTERYVVANREIGPGDHLEAGDLGLATVDLPAGLRGGAFTDPDVVVGAIALGPLGPGELLQSTGIEAASDEGSGQQVSFSVETDWAVAGSLRVGDRIDVYATVGDGAGATTARVLTDATVQRLAAGGGDGLGESRSQTITVTITDTATAASLVNAARTATITVVRVTGNGRDAPPERPSTGTTTTTTAPPRTTTTSRGGR